MLECIEIGKVFDSTILSLWFADGTNYPGQGDFRDMASKWSAYKTSAMCKARYLKAKIALKLYNVLVVSRERS